MNIERPRSEKGLEIALFDANSYFASCHQAVEPNLRQKPLLVGGDPKKRTGIVLTASLEARQFGVKTAMPINQALRLCPDALIVQPDFSLYMELSEKMWEIVGRYTDPAHLQIVSIDECFADFGGSRRLFGDPTAIAKQIQKEIWEELNLGVSVGLSYCKVLAKLASEYARDAQTKLKSPRSFTEIHPDDLAAKIWPLPVGDLSGIGAKTQERLRLLGVKTIGELALYPPEALRRQFGVMGDRLHYWAHGLDDRPVNSDTHRTNRSLGRSLTLPYDITELGEVSQVLLSLADRVGFALRRENVKAKTLTLVVKNPLFRTSTYAITLPEATDLTEAIYTSCRQLFLEKWPKDQTIRLLGITASKLQQGLEQLSLFEEDASGSRLTRTLDDLKTKFGSHVVLRGTQLLPLGQNAYRTKK